MKNRILTSTPSPSDSALMKLNSLQISWCYFIDSSLADFFAMTPEGVYQLLASKINNLEDKSEYIQVVLEFCLKCSEIEVFERILLRKFLLNYLNFLVLNNKVTKQIQRTCLAIFDLWVESYLKRVLRVDGEVSDWSIDDVAGIIKDRTTWKKARTKTYVNSFGLNLLAHENAKYRPKFLVQYSMGSNWLETKLISSKERLRWWINISIDNNVTGLDHRLIIKFPESTESTKSKTILLKFNLKEWWDIIKGQLKRSQWCDFVEKVGEFSDSWIFDSVDEVLKQLIPSYEEKLKLISKDVLSDRLKEWFWETSELDLECKKTVTIMKELKNDKDMRKYIFRISLLFLEYKEDRMAHSKQDLDYLDDNDYILFIINALVWYPGEYTHLFSKEFSKFLPIIQNSWRRKLQWLTDIIDKWDNPMWIKFQVALADTWDIDVDLPTWKRKLSISTKNSMNKGVKLNEVARLMGLLLWKWEGIALWDKYLKEEIYYNQTIIDPTQTIAKLNSEDFRVTLDGYFSLLYAVGNELWSIFDAILNWLTEQQLGSLEKFKLKELIKKTWFVTQSREYSTQITSYNLWASKLPWSMWWSLTAWTVSNVTSSDLVAFRNLLDYMKENSIFQDIQLFGWKSLVEYLGEYEDLLKNYRLCVWNPSSWELSNSDTDARNELAMFIKDRFHLLWDSKLATSYWTHLSQLQTEDGFQSISWHQWIDMMFMRLQLCYFYSPNSSEANWWLSWDFATTTSYNTRQPIPMHLADADIVLWWSLDDDWNLAMQSRTSFWKWWYKLMKAQDWRLVIVPMFSNSN